MRGKVLLDIRNEFFRLCHDCSFKSCSLHLPAKVNEVVHDIFYNNPDKIMTKIIRFPSLL